MRVLVVNAGSSSLKLRLLDGANATVGSVELPANTDGFDTGELVDVLHGWGEPDAVGHRFVHGGTSFTGPVLVDGSVRDELERLTDLAPLHQPKSLAGLDAVGAQLRDVPAVACFDTAFHTTIPAAAATYAVPLEWRERYGIRRYGFRGLSHAYCSRRAATLLDRSPQGLRVVSCHLGAGASLAAVVDGRSVDTTMGFTPLEGLVMATRSGTVDPGMVLWVQEHAQLSAAEMSAALVERSGLTALAGTPDMRAVVEAAGRGDVDATLALEVYVHRLMAAVAAMTAAAQGLDVLAFTGGVGEHAHEVRRRAAQRLRFLGVAIDPHLNQNAHDDAEITAVDAAVRTVVITAREDLQIAAEARRLTG